MCSTCVLPSTVQLESSGEFPREAIHDFSGITSVKKQVTAGTLSMFAMWLVQISRLW